MATLWNTAKVITSWNIEIYSNNTHRYCQLVTKRAIFENQLPQIQLLCYGLDGVYASTIHVLYVLPWCDAILGGSYSPGAASWVAQAQILPPVVISCYVFNALDKISCKCATTPELIIIIGMCPLSSATSTSHSNEYPPMPLRQAIGSEYSRAWLSKAMYRGVFN